MYVCDMVERSTKRASESLCTRLDVPFPPSELD
jgi:hypothetical protein